MDFFESPDILVLGVGPGICVTNTPVKSFVRSYLHLPHLPESLNRVAKFLVYRDEKFGHYSYVLIGKPSKVADQVA